MSVSAPILVLSSKAAADNIELKYSDSIYSPDTAGTAAADQALVLRQQWVFERILLFYVVLT